MEPTGAAAAAITPESRSPIFTPDGVTPSPTAVCGGSPLAPDYTAAEDLACSSEATVVPGLTFTPVCSPNTHSQPGKRPSSFGAPTAQGLTFATVSDNDTSVRSLAAFSDGGLSDAVGLSMPPVTRVAGPPPPLEVLCESLAGNVTVAPRAVTDRGLKSDLLASSL